MPIRVARDVPAKHVCLSSILNGISSYNLKPKHLQPSLAHRSSLEWTLPCRGGDHRFESGMGRFISLQVSGFRLQDNVAINLKSEA